MSLRIIVGPMFAGKTSEIHSIVRRYGSLKKRVLVLTADIDTRYSGNGPMTVTSHDKTSIPAIYVGVHGLVDVLAWPDFKDSDVVVIDEAQFFIGCLATFVQIAVDIYKKHVVIVGLDSDANRKPFGDVLAVMSMADSIEKKTALCKRCGDGTAAIFTRSITHHAAQVTVGGADLYEAVCRKHFSQSAV